MKNITSLLLAAALSAPAAAALAESAPVTVTGKIVGVTCSIRNADLDYPLGVVKQADFVGGVSPWVTNALVSGGCDAARVEMRFASAADSINTALFATQGAARGVAIELQTAAGEAIVPNDSTPVSWGAQPAGGEYQFRARYRQTGASMMPGPADATVAVTIDYI